MLVSECCNSIPWNDKIHGNSGLCAECKEYSEFVEFNPFTKYKYFNPDYHGAYKKVERKLTKQKKEKQ